MKIGIDARSLSVPGGIKIYSENLLNCLNHKKEFILMGPTHFNDFKCIPSKIKNDSILRLFYENIIIPKIIKNNEAIIPTFCPLFNARRNLKFEHKFF